MVGERGHIMLSDDKGHTWTQAESVPTRETLTAAYFADEKRGWAVGHQAVILRTSDGGQTWQKIFSAPELNQPLLDIWFRDDRHGIAIGAYGYFLETSDAGDTWNSRYISEDDWHLNSIDRMDNGKLFIAAESGKVYRSEDDGKTWESLTTPYQGSFHGLIPVGGNSLIIFGLRGHIFRTDDAGDSWHEIDSGVKTLLTGGTLVSDNRLALCGVAGIVLLSDKNMSEFTAIKLQDRRSLAGILGGDESLVVYGEAGSLALPLNGSNTPVQ